MKRFLCALFIAASTVGVATAQDKKGTASDNKPTAQQQRMKDCNASAGEKKMKGDERKKFMSSCLKGEAAKAEAPERTAQQNKMASCNKQAGDKKLKGEQRKTFMSECLKG